MEQNSSTCESNTNTLKSHQSPSLADVLVNKLQDIFRSELTKQTKTTGLDGAYLTIHDIQPCLNHITNTCSVI